MVSVELSNVSKHYGAVPALDGVSLSVAAGEFLTLLGPSGCGKSTLLRIIAGLEPQTGGSVAIAGNAVDHLRPKQRDVAMVFQSYALYPYMTVRDNVGLPLKMRRLNRWQRLPVMGRFLPGSHETRASIDADVSRVAEALEITPLLSRKPGQISGGQRQRVAVGRALVRRPQVFLMDEPLSNLDAKLRVQMRAEIKELHRRLGITFLYVTHDQSEAMTLSDRVAVMIDGQLLQVAPPQAIYAEPADIRVATFVGSPQINLLRGVARGGEIELPRGSFRLVEAPDLPNGASVTLGLRPEAVVLNPTTATASMAGRVRQVEHLGSDVYVHIDDAGSERPLIARAAPSDLAGLMPGDSVRFGFGPTEALLFDEAGRRLRATAIQTPASLQSA